MKLLSWLTHPYARLGESHKWAGGAGVERLEYDSAPAAPSTVTACRCLSYPSNQGASLDPTAESHGFPQAGRLDENGAAGGLIVCGNIGSSSECEFSRLPVR